MISNPAKFFVNGSDMEAFTFEGGKELYHFSPNDNNLSNTMENNLIFFADNEEHGLQILRDLFQFACVCNMKYIRHCTTKKNVHYMEFSEEAKDKNKKYLKYIDAIIAGEVKLSKAPTNQFYIVGWASNDNIH